MPVWHHLGGRFRASPPNFFQTRLVSIFNTSIYALGPKTLDQETGSVPG
jgi:hypothetical protein